MSKVNSLTPVIADFYLYEQYDISKKKSDNPDDYVLHPSTYESKGVFLISVEYSMGINRVSAASVSIGLRGEMASKDTTNIVQGEKQTSQTGLDFLESIFPTSGRPTHQYIGEIIIRGDRHSSLTTLQEEVNAFRGQVQGYGINAGSTNFEFQINLVGFFHNLQQLSIGTPGLHGAVPYTMRMQPIVFHNKDLKPARQTTEMQYFQIFMNDLIVGNIDVEDGFELFLKIVKRYIDLLNQEFEPGVYPYRILSTYKAAIEAYNIRTKTRQAQLAEAQEISASQAVAEDIAPELSEFFTQTLQELKEANLTFTPFECLNTVFYNQPNVSLKDQVELKGRLIRFVIDNYITNPQSTFWDFFLAVLESFGLSFIDFGYASTVIIKNPIMSGDTPGAAIHTLNYIRSEDTINLKIGDRPYITPTRCLVSTRGFADFFDVEFDVYGMYPNENTASQEVLDYLKEDELRGPHVLFYQAPLFLAYYMKNYRLDSQTIKYMRENLKYERELAEAPETPGQLRQAEDYLQRLVSQKEAVLRGGEIADQYAKFIYMSEKVKHRTGAISTRYMPNIFPGMPLQIEDPTKKALIECYPIEVRHMINSNSGTCGTSIMFSHVRYKGDIRPYPFIHPFYSSFKPNDAEHIIENIVNCRDPWETSRTKDTKLALKGPVEKGGTVDNTSWNEQSGGKYTRKSMLDEN